MKTSKKKQCFKASWAKKIGGKPNSSNDWGKLILLAPFLLSTGGNEGLTSSLVWSIESSTNYVIRPLRP
jgi:hypothetical protein